MNNWNKFKKKRQPPTEASANIQSPTLAYQKTDGRMLRKTNRTIQFATKVTPEFDKTIRQLAQKEHCLIVEVLEAALAAYLEKKTKTK